MLIIVYYAAFAFDDDKIKAVIMVCRINIVIMLMYSKVREA